MNYHETLPTTPGDYWSMHMEGDNPWLRNDGVWAAGFKQISDERAASYLPMFGPLPDEEETAIAIACEVAFARMSRAAFKVDYHRRCEFLDAQWKYLHEEPSLSLLREMERVTGELTKK